MKNKYKKEELLWNLDKIRLKKEKKNNEEIKN